MISPVAASEPFYVGPASERVELRVTGSSSLVTSIPNRALFTGPPLPSCTRPDLLRLAVTGGELAAAGCWVVLRLGAGEKRTDREL